MAKADLTAHYALKGDLTTGSINRLLVRLTVPMIWGLLAMISFQLVDMYFISLLGTDQLIAIGFTFPVTMFILSLSIAMGIATSSIISRSIGKVSQGGGQDVIQRLATHAQMIAALGGILIGMIGIPLTTALFRGMGAGPAILPLIHHFMDLYFAGALFLTVLMVGNAALRATGDTLSPALILTLCAVLNVILDPIMIFGKFGFPRLEMQGAALANVLSDAIAMTAGLYILAFRKKIISLRHVNFQGFRDSLKRFCVIAIPVGIANVIQPVTSALIIGMLATSGHEAVAAFGIVARVEAFAFIIIMALATGMAPIIGQNWGAELFPRVHQTLRSAFAFVFIWSLGVAAVLALFGHAIAGLFTADVNVTHTVMLYFWIVPITYAFVNLIQGWASAFNAMGLPKYAFLLIIIRMLVVTLPFAYIGHHMAGVPGLFGGIAAANLICGIGGFIICWRICLRQEISGR